MIIIQVLDKQPVKSKVEATVSWYHYNDITKWHLVISGERTVDVNNDSEIIQISGIVRPADIDVKNSVESFQVAQFNISLKGKRSCKLEANARFFIKFL